MIVNFELAVNQLRPQLYRYARHFVDDREAIEDLCQDAIVRAWQHRDEVRDLKGYLLFVLRGLCFNYRRQPRPILLDPSEWDWRRYAESDAAWRGAATRAALRGAVRRLLAESKLTAAQQRRFWRYYYLGYSYAEIAAVEHRAPRIVRESIQSARLALKRQYFVAGGLLGDV